MNWIPVVERLPEMDEPKRDNGWWKLSEKQPRAGGKNYLVLTKNGYVLEATWWELDGFDHQEMWGSPFPATHWRPLPGLPQQPAKEQP